MEKLEYDIKATEKIFMGKKEITIWVNFINLEKDLLETLQKQFNIKSNASNELSLPVTNPNNIDHPKTKKLFDILEILRSTNKYDIPSNEEFIEEMNIAKKEIPNKTEIKDASTKADELWIQFMKDLNKPEVQLFLKSIGMFRLSDSTFGHKFALNNILLAAAQNPNVSFVQTKAQWKKRFRRVVKDNATRIILKVPIVRKNVSKNEKENYMRTIGYSPRTNYDSLSVQQKVHVDTALKRNAANESTPFEYRIFYDISDTEPIDNSQIWEKTVGFENNMTGKLNKVAQTYKRLNGGHYKNEQSEQEKIDNVKKEIYHNDSVNPINLNKALTKGIISKYPDVHVISPQNKTVEAAEIALEQNLSSLADHLIETDGKIVKSENRTDSVNIAVVVCLCLLQANPKSVITKIANENILSMDSYFELRNIINSMLKLININSSTNESKNLINEIKYLNSVEELLNILGLSIDDVKQHEIEVQKNNFYEIFNRLNKKLI